MVVVIVWVTEARIQREVAVDAELVGDRAYPIATDVTVDVTAGECRVSVPEF